MLALACLRPLRQRLQEGIKKLYSRTDLVTILTRKGAKPDDELEEVSALLISRQVPDPAEESRQLGQHRLDPVAVGGFKI